MRKLSIARWLLILAVSQGGKYFYRVVAENGAGHSKPSNTVGPVEVSELALVDEMANLQPVFPPSREDVPRFPGSPQSQRGHIPAAGRKGCLYYLPGRPAHSSGVRLYCFFPGEARTLASWRRRRTGVHAGRCAKTVLPSGDPDYGYWTPVVFDVEPNSRRTPGLSGSSSRRSLTCRESKFGTGSKADSSSSSKAQGHSVAPLRACT